MNKRFFFIVILFLATQLSIFGCGTLNKSMKWDNLNTNDISYINTLQNDDNVLYINELKVRYKKFANKTYPLFPFNYYKSAFKTYNNNYGLMKAFLIFPFFRTNKLCLYNNKGEKTFQSNVSSFLFVFDYYNYLQDDKEEWSLALLYLPKIFSPFFGQLFLFGKKSPVPIRIDSPVQTEN